MSPIDNIRGDDRALAVGIVAFIAMIAVAALLFILFNAAMSEFFETTTSQAQTSEGADQIDLAKAIWNNILFVPLFLAVLFIVARAVFEQRQPG